MLSKIRIFILGTIAALIIKILYKLVRWDFSEISKLDIQKPTIFAFWHGSQILMAPVYKNFFGKSTKNYHKIKMLVSRHTDGRIIAKAVKYFGIDCIYGSSSRGGSTALRELLDVLESGHSIAITPDGPKGPIYKVKPGIVFLAKKSGANIVPVEIQYSNFWTVNSWDKMKIPKPFSNGILKVGESVSLEKLQTEDYLQTDIIENKLNKLSNNN